MVAMSGRGWKLPPSLIKIYNEANFLAPSRSRRSDGSIGDLAHAMRTSDHNAQGGWVHAIDLTHSPATGYDAHAWARAIAIHETNRINAGLPARINYIISNGMIWKSSTRRWTRYTGSNAHISHVHYSIHRSVYARSNVEQWHVSGGAIIAPPTNKPPVAEDIYDLDTEFEEGESMKLYRDHNGAIWMWYNDDTRSHIASMDEVVLWRDMYRLAWLDFGPGGAFDNKILSQAWLNRIPVR